VLLKYPIQGLALVLAAACIAVLLPRPAKAGNLSLALHASSLNTTSSQVVVQREGGSGPSAKTCRVTGCSREICSDHDQITPCIWKPEYSCYRKTLCELQPDGGCGWAMTPELKGCLIRAASSPTGDLKRRANPPPH
jgi:hypothetical protein